MTNNTKLARLCAVDRNGSKNFQTNQHVKGETASRRAEGAPLTC
jgi:hypothetical protein